MNEVQTSTEGETIQDLLSLPATNVASLIRDQEVSSRELTEALFARIDALNPVLNAVVELRHDEALRESAAADDAVAKGRQVGPLHGVPITIKESFNVAGMHTTWGDPHFKDYVADWDATVVARLRRAGAVIAGKSNVHFMLSDFAQTANELYGATNNPWDLTRTPGGSSGGSAAAVSAGMTFLDYGSDLVGSVRIPASFCGVYGLRPSVGIVPVAGFQPPGPPAAPSEMTYISSLGPLARSAADLRVSLRVTAGPEGPFGRAYTWNLPAARHKELRDFRVGVVLDHEAGRVSSDVGSVLSDAMDALARAGVKIQEGWPGDVDPMGTLESFSWHVNAFFAFQQGSEGGSSFADFIEHENRRMAARAAWNRYFENADVFLCPTNFTPAIPHDSGDFDARTIATPEGDRAYTDQVFWISQPSLAGLPAASAPVGKTSGGLPVGAQVIGPLYEDDNALTFAELMADVIGGYEPPPIT